jgi:hypothetical protein
MAKVIFRRPRCNEKPAAADGKPTGAGISPMKHAFFIHGNYIHIYTSLERERAVGADACVSD